ncbi:hypothetical protein CONLIGDRAFT_321559 [Coniochaeta ligniaria NRRL 30616]|uniref:Uncharacterized protein n=1 Tax=Coniochaeta ligniaria NRRL 30616 TaxID=1408157 RepID=A0A1J7IPR6_9PEZI|nr:hypothetical protein CONLIGDRAFT_321559 [Coniochaeta ligniaria NRRL 30616]
MSLLAREAQRGRIRQIMKSIDAKIRPEIQRAITETKARSVSTSGSIPNPLGYMPLAGSHAEDIQPETFRTVDDERPNASAPRLRLEDTAITTKRTSSTNRDVLPKLGGPAGTMDNSISASLNCSLIQGLSGKSCNGITPGSSMTLITDTSRTHTTFSNELAEYPYVDGTDRVRSFDQDPLFRMAISLQHLRSGCALPKGIFLGATSDDLSVLDDLYQGLSRMVQAIDRRVAALVKTASEGFDRHMVSSGAGRASTRRPRRFKGQEDWQLSGGKKTHWNANADWGSEVAWSEVEIKQAELGKKGPSSKLRHQYIPYEWNLSAPGSPS